jgi:hypothetical protein
MGRIERGTMAGFVFFRIHGGVALGAADHLSGFFYMKIAKADRALLFAA